MAYERQPVERDDLRQAPRPRPAPAAAAPPAEAKAAAEPRASWVTWLARAAKRRRLREPEPAERSQDYAGLLSYLRASIHKPVPTVVIAGAASGNGTSRVADGLAQAARASGLRLFFAELGGTPGRPVLQQRRVSALPPARGDRRLTAGAPAEAPAAPPAAGARTGAAPAAGAQDAAAGAPRSEPSAPTDLVAPSAAGALQQWFDRSGAVDFILVEAPPLDTAADAALLARACDGLMLVVQSEVTPRDSLRRSIRLAEASGCRVLGLVMSERRESLPGWLRRLVRGVSPDRRGGFESPASFAGPAS